MDIQLLHFINGFAGDYAWLDFVGRFLAEGAIVALIFLAAILCFSSFGGSRSKNRYAFTMAVEAYVIARLVLAPLISNLLPRLRPFVEGDVSLLINIDPSLPSFPSIHTLTAFVFALPVLIHNRKVGVWLVVVAGLIGLARVFVGVHYPSDVLGGFVLAAMVVLFLNFFRSLWVTPLMDVWRKKKSRSLFAGSNKKTT